MTTIDFSSNGTFSGSVYHIDGVTITGTGTVVDGNSYIGINDELVNTGETITFSFDSGAATDVSLLEFLGVNGDYDGLLGEATIQAFGVGGNSLGTQNVDFISLFDGPTVSQLFGGVPISKLQMSGKDGDFFGIGQLSFTPVVLNQPPDAQDDTFAIKKNETVTLNVLGNDTDPNSDPLTITGVSSLDASIGSLTNNGTSILFDPNDAFSGTASFSYTISDGKGGSDTATVTVAVGGQQSGGNGRDTLTGNNGNDLLDGGNGDDIL